MEERGSSKPSISKLEELGSSKPSISNLEKNLQPENDESVRYNVSPFTLEWTLGINVDVALVNLTTKKRDLIAYACSHVVVLFDYASRDTIFLQGHQNAVRSLSASRDGKWLLSADYDEDCVCIVWDTETRVPICSLFNPHGRNSLTAVEISPNDEYLVTVGNEKLQIVNFWLWTRGNEEADATAELSDTSADRVKRISFNEENPAEFVLTLDHSVIFVSWDNSKCLETQRPKIPTKNRRAIGDLSDSCYVSKSQLAMTATDKGFVLVWSDVVRGEQFDNEKNRSWKKRLVKAVRLQKEKLTCIKNEDEIIAIGNNAGQLFFYDHQLRLLYWCKNFGLDSIVSMSFDRRSELKRPEIAASESTDSDYIDDISTLDSLEEEEESLEDFETSEDEETMDEEVAEEKFEDFEIKANEAKKCSSKLKNNSKEATKLLAASSTSLNIDYQSNGKATVEEPTNCTLQAAKFFIPNFFVFSATGKIARLDISSLKCRFVLHPAEGAITAIATRPRSDYVVTGNSMGHLRLYKYTTRTLIISKRTPVLPDFRKILNFEEGKNDTTYVTCPQTHESLVGVSALRFSPAAGGILVCGLESGAIWILDPNTLDPLDSTPYKHSARKILDLIFSDCGKYFAYSDDGLTVGVFKKNEKRKEKGLWIFLGKYHSHFKPVTQILFAKPATGKTTLRFFSLGEDRNLVEYDLENSGPYPEPGLKILQMDRVERTAIPTCMTECPEFGVENFLIFANSEHKIRLLNDQTKGIRATFLGPTFGDPVQRMLLAKLRENGQKRGYMIFATSKEIGLMILPFDGNPHRIVVMIGHSKKVQSMAISYCGRYLFTLGLNDSSALMWKIRYRSVDKIKRLGGEGLSPFYSLVQGGSQGWLFKEMKDLFYYAQILQQGENTTSSRIVTDKVSVLQLPNLMRAVGFYPTNNELENMMEEVSYKNYAETGQLVDEITFEEFVKLYVNHRPAFGISKTQIEAAFKAFSEHEVLEDNPSLTAKQFLDVLFGRGRNIQNDRRFSVDKLYGEPLSIEEAHAYLRRLLPQDEDSSSCSENHDGRASELSFDFLPPSVTHESFAEEILGLSSMEIDGISVSEERKIINDNN